MTLCEVGGREGNMTVEELPHKSGQRIKQQHPARRGGQPGITREGIKNGLQANYRICPNFDSMGLDLSGDSKLVVTFEVHLGHIATSCERLNRAYSE